jgi:hypothetical protein
VTPEYMDRRRILARLPLNAPERCLYLPHDFTIWGPWSPLASAPPSYDMPEPEPLTMRASRDRTCRRCGYTEAQNLQGKIIAINDPLNIEKRRRNGQS